jgi:hypothetical protein
LLAALVTWNNWITEKPVQLIKASRAMLPMPKPL